MNECAKAVTAKAGVGCDYQVFRPLDEMGPSFTPQGSCFAAVVVNPSAYPVSLDVSYRGKALDAKEFAFAPEQVEAGLKYRRLEDGKVPPLGAAILFLSQATKGNSNNFVPCPPGTTAAVYDDSDIASLDVSLRGETFSVRANSPVSVYDIYPFGGAASFVPSAAALLPTHAWGTDYVSVSHAGTNLGGNFASYVIVASSEDGNEVTLVSPQQLAYASPGQPFRFKLDRGQYVALGVPGESVDLTGTILTSTKPIGVWGGAGATNIPANQPYADLVHQQIPPVTALGNEYVAVRYKSRIPTEEIVPWRIVAAVDDTQLSYEPAAPPGAPLTMKRGESVTFWTPDAFVVRSQDDAHPFYVGAYMTGTSSYAGFTDQGDPEWVNVVPTKQYVQDASFFTDPTYLNTHLVVVRARGATDERSTVLDCAGMIADGWTPLGSYEYARVDIRRDGADVGACKNGYRQMSSTAPFTVTAWGLDSYASYAYPAAQTLRTLNTVEYTK